MYNRECDGNKSAAAALGAWLGTAAKTREMEYPGVVQLIERLVWDQEAASLSLATRTKGESVVGLALFHFCYILK